MKFNPKQPRDKHGRWTSGISAVPYTRHSLRSQTAGINAGTNITKHYRVSAGVHIRLERRSPTNLEKSVIAKRNTAINKLVSKVSPSSKLDKVIEGQVRSAQNKAISKVLGHQVNVPGSKLNARGGTTRSGLPSVTLRYGGTKKSASRRASGIAQFNNAMHGRQVAKAASKIARPQRRGKKVA